MRASRPSRAVRCSASICVLALIPPAKNRIIRYSAARCSGPLVKRDLHAMATFARKKKTPALSLAGVFRSSQTDAPEEEYHQLFRGKS